MSFPLMPFGQATPPPGEYWDSVPITTSTMYDITVNPSTGRWLAAGSYASNSAVFYSDDMGINWTPVYGLSTVSMESAAYGNGLFVASDLNGDNLFSSPDGVSWTTRISGASRDHNKITFNDGYFVLGSGTAGGSGYIYGSSNGTTWTYGPQGAVGANSVQCGIYVAALGRTFAAGNQWKYVNAVPTASVAWTGTPTGLSGIIYGVTWSSTLSLAVAVGSNGIYTSPNLTTWTLRHSGVYLDVVWTGDQFIVVGQDIVTSPDGTNWTTRNADYTLECVAYYAGIAIAGRTSSSFFLRSQ